MTNTNDANDVVDFALIGRALRRRVPLIVGCALAGGLAGLAVVELAPPRFKGTASLVISAGGGSDSRASLMEQVEGIAGGLLSSGSSSPMETELAILESRAVARHVVDSLRLSAVVTKPRGVAPGLLVADVQPSGAFAPQHYTFDRVASAGSGTAGSFSYSGPAAKGVATPGQRITLPTGSITLASTGQLPAHFELTLLDEQDAMDRLENRLEVEKDKGEVANIVFSADDSLSAAQVPNAIVATYMGRRMTADRGVDQRRVEFLTLKLDSLNGALASSETALRRQQESSGVIDPTVVGKLELERAGELRTTLADLEVERAAGQRLLDGVNAHTITPRQVAAFPTFLKSTGINALLAQLTTVESQRDVLLGTRTARDPQVQALDSAASDLESQLEPLTATYVHSIADQEHQVTRQFDSLQAVIATLPRTTEAAGRLQRSVLDLSKLSAALQAQLVDAKLGAIAEGGDVHSLDQAMVPKFPSFPRPKLTVAVGLAAGLVLGVIMALLTSAFGRWMQDPAEVERSTGVPALKFDPAVPLLVSGSAWRTILVAPVDDTASVSPVVQRLLRTAASRCINATVLDLSNPSAQFSPPRVSTTAPATAALTASELQWDVNSAIVGLEQEHDLVIVQLPGLVTDVGAAAMRDSRPVLLVTPERRIDRSRLTGAVQLLKRLDVPCAGIVMSGGMNGARLVRA